MALFENEYVIEHVKQKTFKQSVCIFEPFELIFYLTCPFLNMEFFRLWRTKISAFDLSLLNFTIQVFSSKDFYISILSLIKKEEITHHSLIPCKVPVVQVLTDYLLRTVHKQDNRDRVVLELMHLRSNLIKIFRAQINFEYLQSV